ncbi:hypothetical protein [Armatimonas sp.]
MPLTFNFSTAINHETLTYFFNGRNYRLTDVAGNAVKVIVAEVK